MLSDMEILSQMIKDTALARLERERGELCVRLIEPQAPGSSVIVRNLPADALVIKVDKFPALDAIFYGRNGECKRGDYIIISAQKKCIIYIEMKSTKGVWKQVVKQLRGTQCFVKYFQELGKEFWEEKQFLNGYQSRFICLEHTRIPKNKTQYIQATRLHDTRNPEVHDTPDKAIKVNSLKDLQFNRLARLGV